MKRITRDRKLTPEEAEKYNNIRKQVDSEKSVISARIRGRLANQELAKRNQSQESTLGQRLRAVREALGESQVTLAASAEISQGYLSQIETDEREPTFSIAVRLARALGVSLDELAARIGSTTNDLRGGN